MAGSNEVVLGLSGGEMGPLPKYIAEMKMAGFLGGERVANGKIILACQKNQSVIVLGFCELTITKAMLAVVTPRKKIFLGCGMKKHAKQLVMTAT